MEAFGSSAACRSLCVKEKRCTDTAVGSCLCDLILFLYTTMAFRCCEQIINVQYSITLAKFVLTCFFLPLFSGNFRCVTFYVSLIQAQITYKTFVILCLLKNSCWPVRVTLAQCCGVICQSRISLNSPQIIDIHMVAQTKIIHSHGWPLEAPVSKNSTFFKWPLLVKVSRHRVLASTFLTSIRPANENVFKEAS